MTDVPNSTIVPTHSCFDDAIEFFELFLGDLRRAATVFRVVHGVLRGHDEGEPYGHGWVEQLPGTDFGLIDFRPPARVVWQGGLIDGARVYFALDRSDFFRGYGVQRFWSYTLQEAVEHNMRSGHYGPWQPEVRELVLSKAAGRIVGRAQCGAPLAVIWVED